MAEYIKLMNTLSKLNIPQNTVTRGYFKKFAYNEPKIIAKTDRSEFKFWAKQQTKHPQHFKIESDPNNLSITIKFTNESTNKGIDNQKILDKDLTTNPNYWYIKKGFKRTFDCNNQNDVQELNTFLLNMTLEQKNQTISDFNQINFQDLNLMDQFPFLTKSLVIQAYPLDIITPNGDKSRELKIVKGHSLAENGKIHATRYNYSYNEHKQLANDSRLATKNQIQHDKIATEMAVFQPLLSNTKAFIKKFIV